MDGVIRLSIAIVGLETLLAGLFVRLYRIMSPHQTSMKEYLLAGLVLVGVSALSIRAIARAQGRAIPQTAPESEASGSHP